MAKASPFDPELVRELANLIAETDLTEIEVEKGDLRIRLPRSITATIAVPTQATAAACAQSHGTPALPTPVAPPGLATAGGVAAHSERLPSPVGGTACRNLSPD